jgi:hypothetical protein
LFAGIEVVRSDEEVDVVVAADRLGVVVARMGLSPLSVKPGHDRRTLEKKAADSFRS